MGQIKVTKAPIEGLYIIEPAVHGDSRGYFMETYNYNEFAAAGLDMTFVQDDGWYAASNRYDDFIRRHQNLHILFLELGVGTNTPVILQNPFWRMTSQNPKAVKPRKMLSRSYCRILTQNIKRAVIRYFPQNRW